MSTANKTPKQKTVQLINKMRLFADATVQGKRGGEYSKAKEIESAKQLVLIIATEMITEFGGWPPPRDITIQKSLEFWKEVRKILI